MSDGTGWTEKRTVEFVASMEISDFAPKKLEASLRHPTLSAV